MSKETNAETRIHPVTGELCRRDVRKQTLTYKNISEEVMMPGCYPEGDGDSIHTGRDMRASDAALMRIKKNLEE